MSGVLFLDWRPHNRRAENLAEDLGGDLFVAPGVLRKKVHAPLRYLFLTFWTLFLLARHRPRLVIVTSPPTFLPIIVFVYSSLFRARYVVDSHHLAMKGLWSRIPFGFRANRYIMNKALITLVHNERIESLAKMAGVNAMTLETRIREPTRSGTTRPENASSAFTVLVPCSFDPDEPIRELYEAAEMVPDVRFLITGNLDRLDEGFRDDRHHNVVLTGFLPQAEYDSLLLTCDAVLAMSERGYPVRPRAASEAIAAQKPLIVTRNPATLEHLSGAVFIDNSTPSLVAAVRLVQRESSTFSENASRLLQLRRAHYANQLRALKSLLGEHGLRQGTDGRHEGRS